MENLKNTEIKMVVRIIGSNESISQLDSSLHFHLRPFGTKLPTDMFDDTGGCTLVSFCIPPPKILEIGSAKSIALFNNAQVTFDMVYPKENVLLAPMGKVMRGLNCTEFLDMRKEAMNLGSITQIRIKITHSKKLSTDGRTNRRSKIPPSIDMILGIDQPDSGIFLRVLQHDNDVNHNIALVTTVDNKKFLLILLMNIL